MITVDGMAIALHLCSERIVGLPFAISAMVLLKIIHVMVTSYVFLKYSHFAAVSC